MKYTRKYISVLFELLIILEAVSGDEEIFETEYKPDICSLDYEPLDTLGLEGIITSKDYPNPYPPSSNHICALSFDPGYSIEVTIDHVDIDSSNGDGFLFFRGGKQLDTHEKGPVITWSIPKGRELKFKIYHSNSLYVLFFASKNLKGYTGFKLHYKRIGEITTTEVPTTPTTPLPTVAPNDPFATIDIHVYGMSPRQFNHNLHDFTTVMVSLTNDYITKKQLNVEQCETKNIQVQLINYCNINWPNHDKCTEVKLAIPLFTKDNNTKYELSEEHLKELWKDYGNSNQLKDFGIEPYILPDRDMLLLLWVGISVGVIIIFLIILGVIWKLDFFAPYSRFDKHHTREFPRDSEYSQSNLARSSNTDSFFDSNDNRAPIGVPSGTPMMHDPETHTVNPHPDYEEVYHVEDSIDGRDNYGLSEDTHSDMEDLTIKDHRSLANRRSDPIHLGGVTTREFNL